MGWSVSKLGSLLNIQSGYAFDSKKFVDEGGVPLIRIRDISDGYNTVVNYEGDYDDKYLVKNGDYLIGMDGEFRCYEWKGKNALLNQRVCRLESFDTSLYSRFLFYGINKYLKDIEDVTAFTTVKHISAKQIKDIEFPIPPIQEQKRIVAILDQAFADIDKARALTEQNLKNARELFESYLQQVFSQRGEGWKTTSLKSIASKIGSGATPKGGKAAYKEEGISLIRSMNVHDRLFVDKDLAFIDDKQAEKLSNVVVEKDDVLLNITGASVARCCVALEQYLPARVNQHVSIIRINKQELLPAFLNYGLTSKFYKDQLLGIGEAGSTRQAITKAQIESFQVSYPESIDKQERYVKQLNALESQMIEMKNIYEKKLKSLEELKKSLLQKAFSGELTKDKQEAA
jgi:type I restriction enzyme S subunit